MTLNISSDLIEALRNEANKTHPNECCGILLGAAGEIAQIQPATNVHPTPETHFEIDPATLIAAYKIEREGGPNVIGYYHSHPKGLPEPSKTDQASAAGDDKVWAIIGCDKIRFWRDGPVGFKPLSYEVVED
ncbi:M67 family metallopeptidase [Pontixanthobacter aestiaquae]|uniref:Peptidase n=1 Tax=Pontixanthobacter aestiaquae TaxID=1509367 RepID=A0A844Z4M9_9SPHN|nr:M67 family metallopeptidase [Pontixanthobacter aestiaquae]MDN3646133.1 M67 family metallopeptidase [Pontixanthobacter aestiaquae]MXO82875.1 peptidase [Pontixanthobacter aestiaquae]